MGHHSRRPPRSHRRARARTRCKEDRVLAGGFARDLCRRSQAARYPLRRRCRRNLHHLERGGAGGRVAPGRVQPQRRAWCCRGGGEGGRHQMRALLEDPAHGRRGPRLSRRLPPRRQGAAGMEGAGGDALRSSLRAGLIAAVVTLVADQASKLWLLDVFGLAHRGTVRVTPFFDLVLAWNIGISFGWLQNDSTAVQLALMAVKGAAVIALAIWMARPRTRLASLPLGLIIEGPIR